MHTCNQTSENRNVDLTVHDLIVYLGLAVLQADLCFSLQETLFAMLVETTGELYLPFRIIILFFFYLFLDSCSRRSVNNKQIGLQY
jgi:hypothetical protein